MLYKRFFLFFYTYTVNRGTRYNKPKTHHPFFKTESFPSVPQWINKIYSNAYYTHLFAASCLAKLTTTKEDDMLQLILELSGGDLSSSYSFVHCKPDSEIPLVGRLKILDDIRGAWSRRAGSGGACDRILFPLPVIVGVPGSGKTYYTITISGYWRLHHVCWHWMGQGSKRLAFTSFYCENLCPILWLAAEIWNRRPHSSSWVCEWGICREFALYRWYSTLRCWVLSAVVTIEVRIESWRAHRACLGHRTITLSAMEWETYQLRFDKLGCV